MKYLPIALIFLFISCETNAPQIKKESKIENDTIYDIEKGELVHEENDSLWFEPYEKRIPKVRKIFKKGKNYMYRAVYKEESGKLLSNSVIKLYPSGERIEFAPDSQDKITYEYLDYESDMSNLKNHKINQEARHFKKYAAEGIIENVEEVWIHPMRQNQYLFTEVAPFPKVKFPLVIGEEWESTLNIQEAYGEWANTSGTSEYKVIKKDTFLLANRIIDCWLINAESTFPFGRSKLSFKFNEDYGFVLMDYVNYEKETLSVRMVRVEE